MPKPEVKTAPDGQEYVRADEERTYRRALIQRVRSEFLGHTKVIAPKLVRQFGIAEVEATLESEFSQLFDRLGPDLDARC